MNTVSRSRQPPREAWSIERLTHERAIALGLALEPSSISSYSSALHSYISFCNLHSFPVEPTADTLSFFVVFMSHHIKPSSVSAYLSGICNRLEPFYPSIRLTRRSPLVTQTLTGCTKMRALPVFRQRPVSFDELMHVYGCLVPSDNHDTLLFLAIMFCSFHGLLRIGESVWPDSRKLQDYRKVVRRCTVNVTDSSFSYLLPSHKADRLYEGNKVLIHISNAGPVPLRCFTDYLRVRDKSFPLKPELWLREDGSIPTRRWICTLFDTHFQTRRCNLPRSPRGTLAHHSSYGPLEIRHLPDLHQTACIFTCCLAVHVIPQHSTTHARSVSLPCSSSLICSFTDFFPFPS